MQSMRPSNGEQKSAYTTDWYRHGNFSHIHSIDNNWTQISDASYQNLIQAVEFRNTAYYPILRKININYFLDGTLVIQFIPTYLTRDKLNSYFYAIFSELRPEIEDYEFAPHPRIVITPTSDIKIFDRLEQFSQKLNELDSSIIEELNTLIKSPGTFKQHKIKTMPRSEKEKNRLFQYYEASSKLTFSIEKFEYLLSQGEQPNSCLQYAIHSNELDILELLLQYGSNPLLPQDWVLGYISAFELAYEQKNKSSYQLIFNVLNKPKRAITASPIVIHSEIREEKDHIYTSFLFNDKRLIYTKQKMFNTLTKKERDELKALFVKDFRSEEKTSENLFEQDFVKENPLIELIYDNTNASLKGYHSYHCFLSERDLSNFIVYGIYVALEASCRGYAIMPFISYRIAFALQKKLKNDFHVDYFLEASDYSGYRMAEEFKHFPKYQIADTPDKMKAIIKQIYESEYGKSITYTHDGLTCYLKTETRKTQPFKANQLGEKFFDRMKKNGNLVPVSFSADEESYKKWYKPLGSKTDEHLERYGRFFANKFPHFMPNKKANITNIKSKL